MKFIYKILIPASALLIGSCIICFNSDIFISDGEPDIMNHSIYIISDIHFFSERLHDRGILFQRAVNGGDGKNLFFQEELLLSLMRTLESEKPEVLLVTGDLTLNGERRSHRDFASFLKKIKSLGIKVFVIPGNHDINNPRALKFDGDKVYPTDTVSPENFTRIYHDFGYRDALSYDPVSLSYMVEPVPGIRILMLDTNKYENNRENGTPAGSGHIRPETRQWIAELSGKAAEEGKRVLVAMHHSLIEHNTMVSEGFTIDDSEALVSFLTALEIPLVLTGHIHIQDIVKRETGGVPIYDIATNAFPVYPHHYGVLTLEENRWMYRSHPVDVAGWAAENGRPDLENFGNSAREFFIGRSDLMVKRSLEKEDYSDEEILRIARIAGELNVHFFSGQKELNDPLISDDFLDNLFHEDSLFLKNYLKSILHNDGMADNNLLITFPE